jgi:ABC-2 type transport system ATP-binding protein
MVKDLIVSLRNEGTTVFFNTHILADVEEICDKISIINY